MSHHYIRESLSLVSHSSVIIQESPNSSPESSGLKDWLNLDVWCYLRKQRFSQPVCVELCVWMLDFRQSIAALAISAKSLCPSGNAPSKSINVQHKQKQFTNPLPKHLTTAICVYDVVVTFLGVANNLIVYYQLYSWCLHFISQYQ